MLRRYTRLLFVVASLGLTAAQARTQPPDLNDLYEKAIKDAVKKVAPSVVQIVTTGGTDLVVTTPKGPIFRKNIGPTTGVITSADGYIVSSAFNFINNPTTILVAVPGHKEPYVAEKVATDRSRMLTLLKITAKNLPVPAVTAKKDIKVGQWAIALGRTLDPKADSVPSVSVGIISAVGRIWGKAIQTDAKISPVNYGGPLVDIQGRVQAILVPASPRGEDETAGFEWYDSGIGFAIPMEDVLAVLPRLMQGKELKKGMLGVRLKSPDIYGAAPEVADVTAGSAASKAGLKTGDIITEIDGHAVVRMAQVLHLLGPRYEGDVIALKYRRGKKEISIANLELVGALTAQAHPFLGILPLRDDPKLGVELRYVYAGSPADMAGLKAGDRIVKYAKGTTVLQVFKGQKPGRGELTDFLNVLHPGEEIKLEVVRKGGKAETVNLKLEQFPGTTVAKGPKNQDKPPPDSREKIPEKLPRASLAKALEPLETPAGQPKPAKVDKDAKKAETGLVKKTTSGTGEHKYVLWVDEDYDPKVAHALVVWLHPPKQGSEKDLDQFADLWVAACREKHIILLMPQSDNDGWVPSDAEFVQRAIRDVQAQYTIDRQRVVTHGLGVGGQMALYLGFNARERVRGVATTAAVPTNIKDSRPNQRLAFFLVSGSRDPLAWAIHEGATKLMERRYPVLFRTMTDVGRQYLNDATLDELILWIDTLDRL